MLGNLYSSKDLHAYSQQKLSYRIPSNPMGPYGTLKTTKFSHINYMTHTFTTYSTVVIIL